MTPAPAARPSTAVPIRRRDEARPTKRSYGWSEDATFLVPDGVGEDDPTRQPVEQPVSLRTIPGLIVPDLAEV
ncbi:MAG: hypothetical protein KDG89_03830 [Geminicoccaceae bacterium]|nr:hypothetical protein [Geminicoccaceae bacterium]